MKVILLADVKGQGKKNDVIEVSDGYGKNFLIPRKLAKVADAIKADGAELIVVGLPVNMDGTQGERAQKCRDFADKLREMTGIETVMWDERVTTVQAIGILNETNVRGKKRKEVIDTVAATLILESYMDYRKKKGLA